MRLAKYLIIAFLITTAILLCLVGGTLLANHPPLSAPPGFSERLLIYLTTHTAETRRTHRFPELELPCLPLPPAKLLPRLEEAMQSLNWQVQEIDAPQGRLRAVITTPVLRFKDDIEIHLVPAAGCTELHMRSSSRSGKGDLGANTRHILDLLQALQRQS
jgi:hypothetical protein